LASSQDDAGNFKTASGLPWAIEIISNNPFKNPMAKVDMIVAFPQFQTWATSNGVQNKAWHDAPAANQVFLGPN